VKRWNLASCVVSSKVRLIYPLQQKTNGCFYFERRTRGTKIKEQICSFLSWPVEDGVKVVTHLADGSGGDMQMFGAGCIISHGMRHWIDLISKLNHPSSCSGGCYVLSRASIPLGDDKTQDCITALPWVICIPHICMPLHPGADCGDSWDAKTYLEPSSLQRCDLLEENDLWRVWKNTGRKIDCFCQVKIIWILEI